MEIISGHGLLSVAKTLSITTFTNVYPVETLNSPTQQGFREAAGAIGSFGKGRKEQCRNEDGWQGEKRAKEKEENENDACWKLEEVQDRKIKKCHLVARIRGPLILSCPWASTLNQQAKGGAVRSQESR